ncbi:MAG: peptidoglycan editing factor PgeF [Halomonadaceae bacterium]|nr:MAG: peptidoglycan editing factor PgeF [Halomonadaceae bacterium]
MPRSDNHQFQVLRPDWPAPATVHACSTTRAGGVSIAPYDSWNLGKHVGDEAAAVAENRRRLAATTGLDQHRIGWLKQVHGTRVARLTATPQPIPEADASVTRAPGLACAILTADCLPVLFCDRQGQQVAAAHAGWRSLAGGVLEQTLASFPRADQVMAWLGPAIGPGAFEVGEEVRQQFVAHDPAHGAAFVVQGDRYLADLYQLARWRLTCAGIGAVYGGDYCTFNEPQRFYSYRRDGRTGRMASLIWLA